MAMRNTDDGYGWAAVLMHWLVAVIVMGLFGLGVWMVDLSYYDEWYRKGPDIHRAVGILLFFLMLVRVSWRFTNIRPKALPGHKPWEVVSAHIAHVLLYILLFSAMVSGYLISTADGSSISVFGVFEVPSITGRIKGMEDTAGVVHYWSTWALIVLAGIHALGALKHHFIDKDSTLRRMLGSS